MGGDILWHFLKSLHRLKDATEAIRSAYWRANSLIQTYPSYVDIIDRL